MQAIRRNVDWRAIPIAGVVAGTVFLFTSLVLAPMLYDVEPFLTLTYFGSLVLGKDVLLESTASTVVVGVVVHYVLSILFTLIIAIVVHRWGLLVGIIGGAILGAALYGINLYTMTVFFPWFFAIHSNVLLLSHVLFGAVAGGIYEMMDTYDLPIAEEKPL